MRRIHALHHQARTPTYVDLPYFPFRTLDRITGHHAAHHVDMNRGNYATLTMLYDRLLGTYERPVSRPQP